MGGIPLNLCPPKANWSDKAGFLAGEAVTTL